jgi:hypothetical protein
VDWAKPVVIGGVEEHRVFTTWQYGKDYRDESLASTAPSDNELALRFAQRYRPVSNNGTRPRPSAVWDLVENRVTDEQWAVYRDLDKPPDASAEFRGAYPDAMVWKSKWELLVPLVLKHWQRMYRGDKYVPREGGELKIRCPTITKDNTGTQGTFRAMYVCAKTNADVEHEQEKYPADVDADAPAGAGAGAGAAEG